MDFKMKMPKIRIPKAAMPWVIGGTAVVTCGGIAGVVTLLNQPEPPVVVLENRIVLSVLDEISVVKGEKTQDVLIMNPSENSYDLQVSMLDEKGKMLYQSDLIEPGSSQSSITLSRVLREDETMVTVIYDCFEGGDTVESIHVETDLLQQ